MLMEKAADISASVFGRFFIMRKTKAMRLNPESAFKRVDCMPSDHNKAIINSGSVRTSQAAELGLDFNPVIAVSPVPTSINKMKST